MDCLIRANLHYLRQAHALVDRLDDLCFVEPARAFYNSSVGGHLRHCIEHYQSFLDGLPLGRIDYDVRARDVILETRTAAAAKRLEDLATAFESLLGQDLRRDVLVKMDCGGTDIPWQPSAPGRELQFLVSHTVHHFAMIGGICQAMGIPVEESFGVAPSTIRHQVKVEAGEQLA